MRAALRRARWIALAGLALPAWLGCATPCKPADTESARRELERDSERCEDQARRRLGVVDVGDYRSCMHVRGWCAAPADG